MLEAFKPFCAAPPVQARHDASLWAAAAFSKAFVTWHTEAKKHALLATERFLRRFEYPSLWETQEMQDALAELCDTSGNNQEGSIDGNGVVISEAARRRDPDADHPRCTVHEYSSLLAFERVDNLKELREPGSRSTRNAVTWMRKCTKTTPSLQLPARTRETCLMETKMTRPPARLLQRMLPSRSSRPFDTNRMLKSRRSCCSFRCAPGIRPSPRSLCHCLACKKTSSRRTCRMLLLRLAGQVSIAYDI